MKQYLLAIAVVTLSSTFLFMGFQCSSAESTSAKLYIQRGDLAAAEAALMKEVEKNPNDAEGWFLLGDIRRQRGDVKGMVSAFESSLKVNKDFESKITERKKLVWGERLNLGVKQFNASRDTKKDSADAYVNMAISSYQDALLVNPDSVQTYQNLAIANLALGKRDEEIKYLKMSLDRKYENQFSTYLVAAYVQKAEAARKDSNKVEAELNFNKAIDEINRARKIEPGNQDLRLNLIDTYGQAGRATEAIPVAREALNQDSTNKPLRCAYASLLLQTKDLHGAVDQYAIVTAMDSSYLDALRGGSVALLLLGQKEKEAATAKEDPKTGAVDKTYQKRFVTGARLLEKYVSIKADEPYIWQALATAYNGAGNTKKAIEALKTSDAIGKK